MCTDGRFRPHVEEFVTRHLGVDAHADLVAVPGGVEPLALLDLVPKDFNFLKRRLQALIEAHGTRRVVLVGHQDCAWYKVRKIGPFRIDLTEQQMRDLRKAAGRLREIAPGVQVEIWFARLVGEPPKVLFEPI